MLSVCSSNHAEVAYATPVCPACMIIDHYMEKVEKLESEVSAMEETAEGYQERIELLESDLEELEDQRKEQANATQTSITIS